MILRQSIFLECAPQRAWLEVQKSKLFAYVVSPVLKIIPIDPRNHPEEWENDRYLVGMRLFGILPFGSQWIVISRPAIVAAKGKQFYALLDSGSGTVIRQWYHRITIQETEDGRTKYTDMVSIDAGLLTPLIGTFAYVFFLYRQKRWAQLVKNNFLY